MPILIEEDNMGLDDAAGNNKSVFGGINIS